MVGNLAVDTSLDYRCGMKKDLIDELNCECLLPSKELAQQVIDEKLGSDYQIITVDIHDFNEDRILAYSTNKHQVLEHQRHTL